ncbi:MAG TPA: nucleoside-diphosphate sugar epimerase/dehydratase [Novosphingobium sp.]|nr:nucleoside-diphosphate sugar epimerase/dehydratase [Novosphingobium sp.]
MKRAETASGGLTGWLLDLPRPVKRLLALGHDGAVCLFSVWLAFYLRLGFWPPVHTYPMHPMIASVVLALPVFIALGLYRAIFRYSDAQALVAIFRAVALYAVPFALIYTVVGVRNVPRTIGIIQPIVLLLMIGGSRMLVRLLLAESYTAIWRSGGARRVLIYGAGQAGRELASVIATSREMRLAGFVDDNPALWGGTLAGVPVLSPDKLAREVARREIDDILLAIPSASRARRGEILQALRALDVQVRTLPSVIDLARGHISVSDLRQPDIEDLLGRAAVPPDEALLRRAITGRTVMVTGAGGSIGSELARQIAGLGPSALVLVDQGEYNLYAIHLELAGLAAGMEQPPRLVPLLASVCDGRRMDEIMAAWRPATVIHAAAYKHVPLVEDNVVEGVRNNVLGTRTTARAAMAAGVESFVLVSTDKAVRPTNVMGASKRLAEMVLQALADSGAGPTRLSMVRFGNVLGSSGSVVPLFRRQIAEGGPVTITHPEITRYFMTIPEAAQLVLQAGAMAQGGEVFVLDMGEPVRIADLARNMIELSGLSVRDEANPAGDIAIAVTGLRPGEKLYEELLIGGDARPTGHPRILCASEKFLPAERLEAALLRLEAALDAGDGAAVRAILRELVPEFRPSVES